MNFVRLVFCVALSGIASVASATTATTSLIPLPAQLEQADGNFQVDEKTPIVVADHEASTRHTADYLADLVGRTRGLHLHVTQGAATANAIVLQRDSQAPVANS